MRDHPTVEYLRSRFVPTVFCPGCGCGIILNALSTALRSMGFRDLKKFVFVSGIGCAAWIPSPHIAADTIHTLHGRAIPVATGVKLARPELKVIVISGDGDLAGIGLGHLIHAARRNIELLVIMVNNLIFAMTGGQYSPTTPTGFRTKTSPLGNLENPIDVCELIKDAGASYVARWTTGHVFQLSKSIRRGLEKVINGEGMAFVEVVSQCPTRVGRALGLKPSEMIRWMVKRSVPLNRYYEENLSLNEIFPVGVYVDRRGEGYVKRYYGLKYGEGGGV